MYPEDSVENLRKCRVIEPQGEHNSAAFSALITHCLPAVRCALFRGEEVLPLFVSSAQFTAFIGSHDEKEEESWASEEVAGTCVYFLNCMLHSVHYFEMNGKIRAGNEHKLKLALRVSGAGHCEPALTAIIIAGVRLRQVQPPSVLQRSVAADANEQW